MRGGQRRIWLRHRLSRIEGGVGVRGNVGAAVHVHAQPAVAGEAADGQGAEQHAVQAARDGNAVVGLAPQRRAAGIDAVQLEDQVVAACQRRAEAVGQVAFLARLAGHADRVQRRRQHLSFSLLDQIENSTSLPSIDSTRPERN
jgi:hypothetical protein